MNARAWISIVNVVAIGFAFVVLFELPQYSTYAFYGLLGWVFASFVLLYAFRVGRTNPVGPAQGGIAGPAGGFAPPPTSALPSSAAPGPPGPVDFCIYCGTTLPIGAAVCPACGHAVKSV